jgi:hypothetical protein
MFHDIDLLACIGHNKQREKEERRKREKVRQVIISAEKQKQVRLLYGAQFPN